MRAAPAAERRRVAAAIAEIYQDACELTVSVPAGVLLPTAGTARLVDIVDLNPNNFLVTRSDGEDRVQVVDFEMQSTHYSPRNRIHVARLFWMLRQRRLQAVALFFGGCAGVLFDLLRCQSYSFARRVALRRPSLASLLVADFRTIAGRALGKVLRLFGIG